jgi:predicted amidohydrolase
LYNTSVVFRPDGQIAKELIKKSFPTSDEKPFVCPADAQNIPVFDTPVGKLGVLICADAWFSAAYKTLKKKGAKIIVVPSYSAGYGFWNKHWEGYSGAETPADAKADVGKITLGEAWQKYAMGRRANNEAGIKKGINVFLEGNLWDLGTDGTSIILNDSSVKTTQKFGGSAIINLGL